MRLSDFGFFFFFGMVGEWVFESEMDMGVGMEFSVHKIKYGFWNQNKRNVVEFTSY
jgi:hypothetical protein